MTIETQRIAAPPPVPGQDLLVYIVDDDEAVRDSLRWLLEGNGCGVRTFASAESFLQAYDPAPFACLVLDVRMHGMSGIELHELAGGSGDLERVFLELTASGNPGGAL